MNKIGDAKVDFEHTREQIEHWRLLSVIVLKCLNIWTLSTPSIK